MFYFSSHIDSSLGFFFIFLGKTRSLILKARKQPTVHLVTSHGCRASPWCRGESCFTHPFPHCPLWIDFSVTQMQLEQFSSVRFLMKRACVHFKAVLSMHAF